MSRRIIFKIKRINNFTKGKSLREGLSHHEIDLVQILRNF